MAERLTRKSVAFAHPFTLDETDGPHPAGVYDIETIEETLDGLSFVAYRRISTTIVLQAGSLAIRSRQQTTIDPEDLAAAIKRDAEISDGRAQV